MSLLTKENVDAVDNVGQDRLKEMDEFEKSFKDITRERALKIYKNELNRPSSIDLGLHGTTRAALRTLCKSAVLESSKGMKRRYSYSALSSSVHSMYGTNSNAISALRMLQKERLIVSRLGFPDRAMELDAEIEVMREKAKKARAEEEGKILYQRMKTLAISHARKEQRLEFILHEETRQMMDRFDAEERKLLKRQEIEFLRVLENATRRAIGRVKKCNCLTVYTCRHNKTASYNTRRPSHTVVQYRRNAKRLRAAGRPEEGAAWDEKAKELDEVEQEKWRKRVADSIVSSPWGANEAAVDQVTELHKRELAVLRKTHAVKRDMHEKKQAMRRKNFRNTILAEERKVRMQCRKQALLRVRKDYDKEQREAQRQQQLSGHSDGLRNVSKNLLGQQFDDEEKKAVDWVPPTNFGLDNSVRLIDAVNEIDPNARAQLDADGGQGGRILTTRKDIKTLSVDKLREKVYSGLKGDNSDEDSDSDDGKPKDDDDNSDAEEAEEDDADGGYKLGSTSGSKLVDRMRKQQAAATLKASQKPMAVPAPSPSQASTTMGSWSATNNNGTINNGLGISNPFGGGSNAFGVLNSPAQFPFQQGGVGSGGLSPFASPMMLTPSLNAPAWQQPSASFPAFGGMSPVPLSNAMAAPNAAAAAAAAAPTAMLSQSAPASLQQSFAAVVTSTAPTAPSVPAPSTPSFRAGTNLSIAAAVPVAAAAAAMPFPSFAPPAGGNNPFGQSAFGGGNQLAAANPFGGASGIGGMGSTFPSSMPSSFSSSFPAATTTMAAPVSAAVQAKPQQHQQAQHHTEDNDDEEDGEADNDEDSNNSDSHHSHTTTVNHGKIDWYFDPIEDMKMPSFKPTKSLKDEDWKEHDEKLANSNGVENSYGIRSIVPEESKQKPSTATVNANGSPSRPYTPIIFSPGHTPATPGTPDSIPMKSALSSKSHFNKKGVSMTKAGTKKSLRFGENVVQVYDNTIPDADEDYSAPQSSSAMHTMVVVDEEEEDVNKNLLTAALSDAAEEKAMYEKRLSSTSSSPPMSAANAANNAAFEAINNSAFGGFGGSSSSMTSSFGSMMPAAQTMPFATVSNNSMMSSGISNNPFGSFPQSSAFGGTSNNNPFGSAAITSSNPFGGIDASSGSMSAPLFMQQQPAASMMNTNGFTPQAPTGPKPTSPVAGGMSRRMSWLAENNLLGPQAGLIASSTLKAEEEIAKAQPPSTRVSLDLSSNFDGPGPLVSTTNVLSHGASFFPSTGAVASGMNSSRVSFDQQSTMFAASNAPSMRNSLDMAYAPNDVRSALLAVQSLNPFTDTTSSSGGGNGKRVSFDLMNTNNMSGMQSAIETAVKTANNSMSTAAAPPATLTQGGSNTFEGYSLPSSSITMSMSTPFAAVAASAQTFGGSAISPAHRAFAAPALVAAPVMPAPIATMNTFEAISSAPAVMPSAAAAASSFGGGFPSSSSFGGATSSFPAAATSTAFGSAPSFPSFAAPAAVAIAPVAAVPSFGGDAMAMGGGMSMQTSFGQPAQPFTTQPFGQASAFGQAQAFGQQSFGQQSFGQAALGSSSSFPIPSAVNTGSMPTMPQQSQQSPVTIKPSPRNRSYGYGEGEAVDLSMEYAETRSQSTTDESAASRKLGPNWDLALFRISNLSNVEETLEFLLQDEELFECAELYISTIGSLHNQHEEDEEGHHDREPQDDQQQDEQNEERELYAHDLTTKLQLLRGWKRYLAHNADNELLLMGLEEVIGLEQEEIMDNLDEAIAHNESKLKQIFKEVAFKFIPEFVLSTDFEAYFETHTAVKSHNKKLRIDSKSWIGKFQKVVANHNLAFHLFPFGAGRPYANAKMRLVFGPMCDTPTPREYIDSSTDATTISTLLAAMKEGRDIVTGVICRTLKSGKPASILSVKHMRSYKNPGQIKYSLVIFHDMTQADAEEKLQVVQAVMRSIPT